MQSVNAESFEQIPWYGKQQIRACRIVASAEYAVVEHGCLFARVPSESPDWLRWHRRVADI